MIMMHKMERPAARALVRPGTVPSSVVGTCYMKEGFPALHAYGRWDSSTYSMYLYMTDQNRSLQVYSSMADCIRSICSVRTI
jgi:hypothetical protein